MCEGLSGLLALLDRTSEWSQSRIINADNFRSDTAPNEFRPAAISISKQGRVEREDSKSQFKWGPSHGSISVGEFGEKHMFGRPWPLESLLRFQNQRRFSRHIRMLQHQMPPQQRPGP